MRGEGKSSREIVYPDQHSRQGRGSWLLAGILRIRKDAKGRSIGHGYHLLSQMMKFDENEKKKKYEPQILMGASNSSKIGWFMKSSRALVHRYLISYSCS